MIDSILQRLDPDIAHSLPFGVVKRCRFLPLRREAGRLEILLTNNSDLFALDEIRMNEAAVIQPLIVEEEQFVAIVQRVFDAGQSVQEAEQIIEDLPLSSLVNEIVDRGDLLESEDDAPIIQLVNSIIVEAVREQASDIHIEPFERDIVVRFRVDGILHTILRPPKPVQASLMSRIKVMAGLNIAEKRLPQDGGMRVQVGERDLDVRISVLPISHGERIVMRLLRQDSHLAGFNELGLSNQQSQWLQRRLSRNHGIILVTGPTGSGKSTTLYTALTSINTPDKNIITVEDPIEYSLSGVGQIQVNPKIGLNFANALRSILRQDPDIIMIGEIRDQETAEIAIQASLTGHLVFSTLHTNDSVGSIIRLIDMAVEPFLIGSSLEAVIAQRLVRKLCPHCKELYIPSPEIMRRIGLSEIENGEPEPRLYRAGGCKHCMQSGYRGRTAIFEMLSISSSIRGLIEQRAPEVQIKKQACLEGIKLLREAGLAKTRAGITSLEETLRVTQEYNEAE